MDPTQPASPRTEQDLVDLKVRDFQRVEAENQRAERARNEVKFATVIAVSDYGDVQLDRFTNEDGIGQWFAVLNRCIPEVGDGVAYTYIEGTPVVLGPIPPTVGSFRILPNQDAFNIPRQAGSDYYRWRAVPMIEANPYDVLPVRFGMPVLNDPFAWSWQEHFAAGFENGVFGGTGSTGWPQFGHWVILTTGSTSGNLRWFCQHSHNFGSASIQGIWDFMVRLGMRSSSSHIVKAGLLDQPSSDPPSGVWFEMQESVLKFVIRHSGTWQLIQDLTTPSSLFATYTARIRCRPFQKSDGSLAWRYTMQIIERQPIPSLGFEQPYAANGDFDVKEEYIIEHDDANLNMGAQFGVQIRNGTMFTTPSFALDYIGCAVVNFTSSP